MLHSKTGILSDGRYTARLLSANITDVAGNPLASADDTANFFSLAGDASHDAVVDITDLGILATNWQKTLPAPIQPFTVAATSRSTARSAMPWAFNAAEPLDKGRHSKLEDVELIDIVVS